MEDISWAFPRHIKAVGGDADEETENYWKGGWLDWLSGGSPQLSRQNDTTADTEALADEWASIHRLATVCTKARSEFEEFGLNDPSRKTTLEARGEEFAKAYRTFQDRLVIGCTSLDTGSIASGKQGECTDSILETAELISRHTGATTMPTQTDLWDIALQHDYRSVAEDIWQQSTSPSDREYYIRSLAQQCVAASESCRRESSKFYDNLEQWALLFDRAWASLGSKADAKAEGTSSLETTGEGTDRVDTLRILKIVQKAESYPDPPKWPLGCKGAPSSANDNPSRQ